MSSESAYLIKTIVHRHLWHLASSQDPRYISSTFHRFRNAKLHLPFDEQMHRIEGRTPLLQLHFGNTATISQWPLPKTTRICVTPRCGSGGGGHIGTPPVLSTECWTSNPIVSTSQTSHRVRANCLLAVSGRCAAEAWPKRSSFPPKFKSDSQLRLTFTYIYIYIGKLRRCVDYLVVLCVIECSENRFKLIRVEINTVLIRY